MSTSPSWFDNDKFSRLVKKVGTKTVPVPNPAQAGTSQALPEKPASQPLPKAPSQALPEKPASQPLPEAPSQPLPEKPASQPLPEKPSRAPSASQRLMTSQSLSISKPRETPPVGPTPPAGRAEEPIRAPSEPAPAAPVRKGPPTESGLLPSTVRRTSALPVLKDVFRYEIPAGDEQSAETLKGWEPLPSPVQEEERASAPSGFNHGHDASSSSALAQSSEDLTAAWERIAQLNDELAAATKERDQAINETVLLREDLNLAHGKLQDQGEIAGLAEELQQVLRERDEALAENGTLREELQQAYDAAQGREAAAMQSEELAQATEERDRVRRDYVDLREQFENLKLEQARTKSEQGQGQAELEQQIQLLRQTLANQAAELSEARLGASGNGEELETLRQELSKKKDEASMAQRGLALSQKALQETREALREATEPGGLVSKASMDNLKKENSTLVQQNMLLQAQHDQVARELSAAKAKLAGR